MKFTSESGQISVTFFLLRNLCERSVDPRCLANKIIIHHLRRLLLSFCFFFSLYSSSLRFLLFISLLSSVKKKFSETALSSRFRRGSDVLSLKTHPELFARSHLPVARQCATGVRKERTGGAPRASKGVADDRCERDRG